MIISLDMHKAYDCLEWYFLVAVLHKFGFSGDWIKLILACISSCNFLVIFQGIIKGFFPSTRGLRQGDRLSASLFILAEDALSRAFNARIGSEDTYSTTLAQCPSHLLFADDIIVFAKAKRRSILKFINILKQYQDNSRQLLNESKCKFYLLANVPRLRARVVASATSFSQGQFPFVYLGVGVLVGPGKRSVKTLSHIGGSYHGEDTRMRGVGSMRICPEGG